MKKIHISRVRAGDTVLHNGKQTTVNKENIKYCSFMGLSLFGDSYNLGYKLLTKINL